MFREPDEAAIRVGIKLVMRVIVYVADTASNEITAFALDAQTGTLELVQRLALAAGVAPLTIAPDGGFMYAMLRGPQPAVATIVIEPANGALAIVATTALTAQMAYLHTDRFGRYLLGASYSGAAFAIHAIDDRGVVTEQPVQVTPTPPHAHCIITDPTNRNLFVTSLGGDLILQYRFDESTGRAIPNDPPLCRATAGTGPRHISFHPTANVVYVNGELDGSVGVYGFDSTNGGLTPLQRVGGMADGSDVVPWSSDLHVTPDGRYLYASERRTSSLAIFAVRSGSGLLDRCAVVTTEAQPRSFAIDPSGRYLVVAGERSRALATYAIDARTGELAFRHRHSVGLKPAWVSVVTVRS